ncbi:hypothetical protein K7X08_003360 [Anisodus acutangulus]|uniref:Uncharacterized protein n=1 Tax=Anisodus acutangulus TaxID=402998 RepID=A0A9Q1RIQ5_9SOLA|nr:hypothetical protein K7X08_003360 [Anisodus acutangulus]
MVDYFSLRSDIRKDDEYSSMEITRTRSLSSLQGQNEQGAADNKSDASVKDEQGGIVKGVVTYMVMDDLMMKTMSTISSITILNKFNIKEVGSLEERIVEIGINEGLKLLNASLESKTILTSASFSYSSFPHKVWIGRNGFCYKCCRRTGCL